MTTTSNVIPLFGTLSFEIKFQELPLFREGAWRGGTIDGTAEVTFDYRDNDWSISDVAVRCDNGRFGAEAAGKLIILNAEEHETLYEVILDAVSDYYASYIEDRVAQELADRGYARAA